MALLSEGSSVKESPEDKQASVPCVTGSTLMWGAHFFCKISAGGRIFKGGRSKYSVTPGDDVISSLFFLFTQKKHCIPPLTK